MKMKILTRIFPNNTQWGDISMSSNVSSTQLIPLSFSKHSTHSGVWTPIQQWRLVCSKLRQDLPDSPPLFPTRFNVLIYGRPRPQSRIGETCAQYESATRETMARIWIREAGRQGAREFDLKVVKFDFLLTYKNEIKGVLLFPLEYKSLTLVANSVAQMHEESQRSKAPRVSTATKITQQPFRHSKLYLVYSIEFLR